MSNSYLTNAARIAGTGRDQGLTDDEVVDALLDARNRKDREGKRALDAADIKAAQAFDYNAAGVPAELGGFGYGNGGEDIEFGVDQADWQVAQADDKDIVAKKLRRAQKAAADIGFDARMREQGEGARVRRAQAIMELRQAKADYNDPGERENAILAARMQNGSNIENDPYIVGPRGRDGKLQQIIRKNYIDKEGNDRGERIKRIHGFVDKKGNVREPQKDAQAREPDYPIGYAAAGNRDAQMRAEIAAERGEAQKLIAKADARNRGQYTEGDIEGMIRRFELADNEGANVPGRAGNKPFSVYGPMPNNAGSTELIRAAAIDRFRNPKGDDLLNLDEFGRPVRNYPARQEFNSIATEQERIIRQEVADRGYDGSARYEAAKQDINLANLIQAQKILNEAGVDEMQMRDQDIANIPTIRDVGNVKAKLPHKAGGFNEGQNYPVAVRGDVGTQGAHFDKNGIPLGVQGPVAANSPTGDNTVNAPRDVRQWAIQNAPGFRNGAIFGDFPQVDIMGAGDDFLARIAKVKAKGQAFDPGISAIRNIDDLEQVVERFGGFAEQGGLKMFHLDADKNEVFRDKAGLPEIFHKVRMNENAQGRLANAIFQLEAGKVNGVNADARAQFEGRAVPAQPWRSNAADNVVMNARQPAFGNDEVQLQKIPRGAIQVGVDAVGEPIKQEKMAALQALSGQQAQPPLNANELRDARNGMVALVQGEGNGDYGFAKQIPEGVDDRQYFMDQAKERAKGKPVDVGRVNQNVQRRRDIIANEAAARKGGNQVLGVVGSAERELQGKGALFPKGKAQRNIEIDYGNWRREPERYMQPSKVVMQRDGFSMPKADPVVAQMSAPMQEALPGISYNEGAPDPWQSPPATAKGITQGAQNLASAQAALPYGIDNDGPTQGPSPAQRQGPSQRPRAESFKQRAEYAANDLKTFATSPRFQKGRRRGYAAGGAIAGLAGLDALIGGERETRDQEVYQ